MTDFAMLSKPFSPDKVSWRVGSTTADKNKGMALAYIDARDVQDRLDEVCGPENWQCRYQLLDKTTICEIDIRDSEGHWVTKADGAAGTDVEAEKGALSDAFKRAAVKWGVGRYLYNLDSPWVELEAAGRSYKIKASEMAKLRGVLGKVPPMPPKTVEPPPKPVDPALTWVTEQMEAVAAITNAKDLAAWEERNSKAITKLAGMNKDAHDELLDYVTKHYQWLNS